MTVITPNFDKALSGWIKCHFIGHHFIAQIGLTSFLIQTDKVPLYRLNKVTLYRSIKYSFLYKLGLA
jgi:hypothetical protein